MTTRYEAAYNAIAREQSRVAERALTMVMNDEERHRRDCVLIALETMRQRLQERGIAVAPQEVLTVFEEVTSAPTRGLRLPTLLADARKRQVIRQNTDPRSLLAEAARSVEAATPARKFRTTTTNPPERD
jgi:hypothetical protein